MGAKYLPTIRDQKATTRFMDRQKGLPKFKKTPDNTPGLKKKKT